MTAEFISTADGRWKEVLARADHGFYHLPGYIDFAALHEGGQPCAYLAEMGDKALLIPLLMRPLPQTLDANTGYCDVLTPYGYPGPVLAGAPSDADVAAMLSQFLSVGRESGVISAFWRLHPLLPFPLHTLSRFGQLVQHGRTVHIDLSNPTEQLWRAISENHRRHIKRLRKQGFTAVRNDPAHWRSFPAVYRDSMDRVGAEAFYFFSDSYFSGLRSALDERLDLWTVVSPQGEVAAAALCITEDGTVEYHLGATAREFLTLSPLKLLIYEAMLHAREAGHRFMHLGGGLGGKMDDPLFSFKSRFSPLSSEFHTFRSVLIPDAYDELAARRQAGRNLSAAASHQFFPAYRA